MKAKRRHELQTNALADWLGRQINMGSKVGTKIADPVRPYSKILLGIAIGVVAVGFAALYLTGAFGTLYSSVVGSTGGPAWAEYFAAVDDGMRKGDAEALKEVAERHENSVAGIWAAQSAGDIELMRGSQLLYRQRDEAEQALKRAKDSFETVLQSAGQSPLLKHRARYGLAQVHECLSVAGTGTKLDFTKHLDQAASLYGELAEQPQDSTMEEMAKRRLKELSAFRENGFYEWLAANEPAPPAKPDEGATGVSSDLGETPELPDFTVPAAEGRKVEEAEKPETAGDEPGKPEAQGQQQDGASPEKQGKGSDSAGLPETSLEPPESPKNTPAPKPDSPN